MLCSLAVLHGVCLGSSDAQGRLKSRNFESGLLLDFHDRSTNCCICCVRCDLPWRSSVLHTTARLGIRVWPTTSSSSGDDGVEQRQWQRSRHVLCGMWRVWCIILYCLVVLYLLRLVTVRRRCRGGSASSAGGASSILGYFSPWYIKMLPLLGARPSGLVTRVPAGSSGANPKSPAHTHTPTSGWGDAQGR